MIDLCHQNGACRKGSNVHALHAQQFPLHTRLDVTHVGGSLLHQLVIHGREHLRIGGADLLNRVFRTDALSGDGCLDFSSQHRIH